MKQYPIYKDSGIQGIDEIPEHWYFSQLKFISYIKGRIGWQGLKSDEFIDEGPFLITGMNFKNGIIRWDEVYHITEDRYNEAPEIQLKKGDVLMTKDGTIGKLLYVDEIPFPGKASLNSHLLVIRPLKEVYYPKYLYYQLDSHLFKKHIEDTKTGTTFYGITQEAVGNFKMIIPHFEEQFKIANFLDQKTSEIEQLITAKEELIGKLGAKRKAIINEAVTGRAYKTGQISAPYGKEVKYKNSGVEWLGEIPEHWEVVKLKYCTTRITTGKTPSTEVDKYFVDGTIKWYSPGDIKSLFLNDSNRKITDFAISDLKIDLYPPNTVLFVGIGATLGKVGIANDYCYSNQQINAIQFNYTMLPEYGLFYFEAFKDVIANNANSATLAILNQSQTKSLLFTRPNLADQQSIVDYVKSKLGSLSKIESELLNSIAKLKLYKQSLISEAVTGKIDVREWQKD